MSQSLPSLERAGKKGGALQGRGVKSCADRLALGTDLELAPGWDTTVPETLPGHGVPSDMRLKDVEPRTQTVFPPRQHGLKDKEEAGAP